MEKMEKLEILARASILQNRFVKVVTNMMRVIIACICTENCRLCKKELSLTLGFNYGVSNIRTSQNAPIVNSQEMSAHFSASKIDRALSSLAQIVSSEAAPPALLNSINTPLTSRQISECLCHVCWLKLETGEALTGIFKLRSNIQSKLPVISGAPYENTVRDLIGRFKYDGDRLLATDLAYVMTSAWTAVSERTPAANLLLVPVPLHKHRLRNRGFNQAELLARNLSFITGIKHKNALVRTIYTKPQQTLGRVARSNNVKGAFEANERAIRGKNIILVDDVCTSGATLIECSEELLLAGANSVCAITVARAIFFNTSADKSNKTPDAA